MTVERRRGWEHLGYLSACEAALQAYGVETAATDADADGLRRGSIEVLVLGRHGRIEPLDLGWTEEHGWGYSRKDRGDGPWDPGRAETYTHGQFGGSVLPEPDRFAHLVVRIAAGEELEDHLPGERLAYRAAGEDDGFGDRLRAYRAGDPTGSA